MSYLVNGTEYTTKKEATDAMFAAAQDGDATLSLSENVSQTSPSEEPGGLAGGLEVIL